MSERVSETLPVDTRKGAGAGMRLKKDTESAVESVVVSVLFVASLEGVGGEGNVACIDEYGALSLRAVKGIFADDFVDERLEWEIS